MQKNMRFMPLISNDCNPQRLNCRRRLPSDGRSSLVIWHSTTLLDLRAIVVNDGGGVSFCPPSYFPRLISHFRLRISEARTATHYNLAFFSP